MTILQQLNVLSETLNQQISDCSDSALIDELVQRQQEVIRLGKKMTGANINRSTPAYESFVNELDGAIKSIKQASDEVENIAKWIERSGKIVGKLCELAAKIV